MDHPLRDRIRIQSVEILSDDWRDSTGPSSTTGACDGSWETQIRQTYDRGNGAAILPYDRER